MPILDSEWSEIYSQQARENNPQDVEFPEMI